MYVMLKNQYMNSSSSVQEVYKLSIILADYGEELKQLHIPSYDSFPLVNH